MRRPANARRTRSKLSHHIRSSDETVVVADTNRAQLGGRELAGSIVAGRFGNRSRDSEINVRLQARGDKRVGCRNCRSARVRDNRPIRRSARRKHETAGGTIVEDSRRRDRIAIEVADDKASGSHVHGDRGARRVSA
jgi:hypothetical protein